MGGRMNGFFAYPATPKALGDTIESAINKSRGLSVSIRSWQELDIPGRFISERVIEGIDESDFLIADISRLNFNVTYEIAYAIGRSKRVILTRNDSIEEISPKINEVGIYDTLRL